MMKIKLLLFLFLIGLRFSAFSQDKEGTTTVPVVIDSTATEKPKKVKKIKVPYRPSLDGIKLGIDLYPLLFTIFEPDFTGYELNSEFVFNNRFFINADWGSQDAQRIDEANTFLYTNKGSYWRIGVDYNFMHKKFAHQAIFVGGRFGQASFDHAANYTSSSGIWGENAERVELNNQSASWMEINLGFKVKVIGNLHLSAILRGKGRLAIPDETLLSVVEIPGFGINRNTVTGSIGYRVSYLFPVSKKGIKKAPKRKRKEAVNKSDLPKEEE